VEDDKEWESVADQKEGVAGAFRDIYWTPSRWWRVLMEDGTLFCETSNEQEAREAKAVLGRDGSKLQRLYTREQKEWKEV